MNSCFYIFIHVISVSRSHGEDWQRQFGGCGSGKREKRIRGTVIVRVEELGSGVGSDFGNTESSSSISYITLGVALTSIAATFILVVFPLFTSLKWLFIGRKATVIG